VETRESTTRKVGDPLIIRPSTDLQNREKISRRTTE
jgi:hypothetical protein